MKKTASEVAKILGHTDSTNVTLMKTVVNPNTTDGHDEMMDLNISGFGDKAYFEWISEYGDPIGAPFHETEIDAEDLLELHDAVGRERRHETDVRSDSDYTDLPSKARFVITEADAQEINRLSALVAANGLHKVEKFDCRTSWLEGDDPDDFREARSDLDKLNVSETEFWFSGYVKHTDVEMFSERQQISEMRDWFELKQSDQKPEELASRVKPEELASRVDAGTPAEGEVIAKLADNWTLRSGVYDEDDEGALISGEYVRLCMPNGDEYAYWDQSEWRDDPALVMGAIINASAGLRMAPGESESNWQVSSIRPRG
jgi:hypothetical protein